MKLVERAYEWLKKQPKEHIETMRKDIDGALATIIDAFRDKSITREQVQIILTEKSEAENGKHKKRPVKNLWCYKEKS